MGCKGEHAVAQYMASKNVILQTLDQRTNKPEVNYDFDHFPTQDQNTEIKTGSADFICGFIQGQILNYDQYQWAKGNPTNKGLTANVYIFCKEADSDHSINIVGWITRDEILQQFPTLHDGE